MREHQEILSRIERLEAQNRALKRGAVVWVLAIASLGLMGQTPTQEHTNARSCSTPAAPMVLPKNIEAESFILKDSAGHVRAELAMGGTGPEPQTTRSERFGVADGVAQRRGAGRPFVLLSDPQHHAGLSMSVLEGAGSQLTLTGERPDTQAHIGVAPDGANLQVTDQEGFSANIGNGVQTTKSGQTKKTTAGSITLFNKDRKVIWTAP